MADCEYHEICNRDARPGRDRCILHADDPSKDRSTFERALETHWSENGPDFRHMTFPRGHYFAAATFERGATFEGATFAERANFEGATFGVDVRFEGATFRGGANFRGALIKGQAAFQGAQFAGTADFETTVFGGEAVFRGATFGGPAHFLATAFEKDATFARCAFEEVADFEDALFAAEATLALTLFEGPALFKDVTFQEEATFAWMDARDLVHYGGATFEEASQFEGASFAGGIFGSDTTFEGPADFSDATILGASALPSATFADTAAFGEATFAGEADFRRATFEQRAGFGGATFGGRAMFEKTVFADRVDFEAARFSGEAQFDRAEFGKEVVFREATFDEKVSFGQTFLPRDVATPGERPLASFTSCTFEGNATFAGGSDHERMFSGWRVAFTDVSCGSDSRPLFQRADLGSVRWAGTNLRDLIFRNVRWQGESEGERARLRDEEVQESEDAASWAAVEQLYRDLKQNYEEQADYPRASDFHIGEKEARRQQGRISWGTRALLHMYRISSMYGERPARAALWLAGLLLAFAVGYVGLSDLPAGAGHALALSVESTFFPFQPVGFEELSARFLHQAQRVLGPILVVLLALSIRQRVRR